MMKKSMNGLILLTTFLMFLASLSANVSAEWFDTQFQVTHYQIAIESDFDGSFVTANGIEGTYREDFLYSATGVCMQGTGQTLAETFIRYDHGGYWVNCDGERTDPPDWENGPPYWIGNPEDVWFAPDGGGACGRGVTPGTSVAADLSVLPCGTDIFIDGIGLRRIDDTGPAIVGYHIDVLVPPTIIDGNYRVYVFDTEPPNEATNLQSPTHGNAIGQWNDPQSRDNTVEVTWINATDNIQGDLPVEDVANGLDGYSIAWDNSPDTLPDETIDVQEDIQSVTSNPLSDGLWYFHIRSVDNEITVGEGIIDERNWDDTAAHLGPFYIDTTPPIAVVTPSFQRIAVDESGQFDGSGSNDSEPDSSGIDHYEWNFGDGSPVVSGAGNPGTVSHAYGEEDTYTVTLRLWDKAGNGGTGTAQVTATVQVPEFPLGIELMIALVPAIPIVYLWRTRKNKSKVQP